MKAGSVGSAIIIGSISVVLIGGLMIYAGLFANASLIQTFDSTLNPAAALSMFTITNNVSQNETVNITINASKNIGFAFNLTGNNVATPGGYIPINITSPYNSSDITTQNLTYAINNNATLSALITAINVTNVQMGQNMTHIVWNVIGNVGNGQLTLSDTVANGSWSSNTLTGGADGMTAYANTKTNVNSAFMILGVVLIFAGIGGLLAVVMGLVGTTGRRQ